MHRHRGWTATKRHLLPLLLLSAIPALARAQSPVSGWGYNGDGGLGDNTGLDRTLAVEAVGLTTAVAVSGGLDFTVALLADGTVKAWGLGGSGQLGDGALASAFVPVDVYGLTGITGIAAGGGHTLALGSDGTVWGWGENEYGQVGDGSTTAQPLPVPVAGLPGDVVAVGCGRTHSFALTSAGEVWAWGDNSSGQLGDGTTTGTLVPIALAGLPPIATIDGGTSLGVGFTVALAADGAVWTWGGNSTGQLGDGTTTSNPVPAPVAGLGTAVAAVAGMDFTLALLADGTVMSWGGNAYGQLGNGTTADVATPGPVLMADGVTPLSDVAAVSAGLHGLALHVDGSLSGWGYNFYGQVGDGTNLDQTLAQGLRCMSGVTQIAAADYHSLALGYNECAAVTAAPRGTTSSVSRLTATHWRAGAGQAEIAFELATPGRVSLEVFDLRGRRVAEVLSATLDAGRHAASWHGRASDGAPVANGVYVVRLSAGSSQDTRKLLRLP